MREIVGVYIISIYTIILFNHYKMLYILCYVVCIFCRSMANHNLSKMTVHSIRGLLEKEILTGSNFLGWHRNLMIVLRQEHKLHVLDDPVPAEPGNDATVNQMTAYQKKCDDHEDVACLMLACMSPEL